MSKLVVAALAASVVGVGLVAISASRKPMPTDLRQKAVEVALDEYDRVNTPGNSADPSEYWRVASGLDLSDSQVSNLDWCGGFYLWALKVAGLASDDIEWKFDGTGMQSAGLRPTSDPQPADLAYFNRNQHHAMVESVDGDTVNLINGNGGGKGITRTSVDKGAVTAFFSVESLMS